MMRFFLCISTLFLIGPVAAQQAPAEVQLPPPPVFSDPEIESAKRGYAPLTPEEILEFRRIIQDVERAKRQPIDNPPKAVVTTKALKPATDEIFELDLYPSLTTTITFLDNTGKPWPIEAFSVSNGTAFQVEQLRVGDNTLNITPLELFSRGNLTVYLPDVPTPFIFLLGQGESQVHLRVDFPIEGLGPQAEPVVAQSPERLNTDPILIDFLNNTPPDGAIELAVDGASPLSNRAWYFDNQLYFRTNLTLLSPDYQGRVNGLGQSVYKLQRAPVLLVSIDGEPTAVRLREKDAS